MLRRIARIKARAVRLNLYIQVWQLLALLVLLGPRWWYIPVVAVFVILYWFETKYGIAGDMDVSWGASETWREYRKQFDQLQSQINEINRKLL